VGAEARFLGFELGAAFDIAPVSSVTGSPGGSSRAASLFLDGFEFSSVSATSGTSRRSRVFDVLDVLDVLDALDALDALDVFDTRETPVAPLFSLIATTPRQGVAFGARNATRTWKSR
jgi:hypothetical protein